MSRLEFIRASRIKAAKDGSVPNEIQLLMLGDWPSERGRITVTGEDVADYVRNYEDLFLAKGNEVPVNYDHRSDPAKGHKAAGWIKRLIDKGEAGLWAAVEWTAGAAKEIANKEWRYISAEFWQTGWSNPLDVNDVRDNVLDGAAITNEPLFVGLKAIAASRNSSNIIFIKGVGEVNLEELRKKKLEELSEDEKKFLAEHKDELTDEERKTFGLAEAEDQDTDKGESDSGEGDGDGEDEEKSDDEEAKKTEASRTDGVVLTKRQYERLQASARLANELKDKLDRQEVAARVEAHVKRGAIKSDQADEAVSIIMASAPANRSRIEEFLKNLPDNKLVTEGERGSNEEGAQVKASAKLHEKAEQLAAEKKISYNEALRQVTDEDPELANYNEEEKE